MKALFLKFRARLGDFWWYSLLHFSACRAADFLNVFVGLWLVPHYVDPSELGAVMPLSQFAGALALPAAIFLTVFVKEINALATRGEYGQIKSLVRGVFVVTGVSLAAAIVLSRLLLPHFMTRMRLAEGSLGILILAASFFATVAPIYSNVLQALKKFNELTLLSLLAAPARFIVMFVTMPFRALSGFFLGQAASPALSMVLSVWFLRRELRVPAVPYWTRSVFRRFAALIGYVALFNVTGTITGVVEQTVLRQRLPDLDSAAYYMTTRFSDIAGYLSCTLLITLFPYTAECAANGQSTRPYVVRASLATVAFGGVLALVFAFAGGPLLRLLPHGAEYAGYAWAIPWLIGISVLSSIQSYHTSTEISAGRFGFLKWWTPLHLVLPVILLLVTGYGYIAPYLPESCVTFLARHNVNTLASMLEWLTFVAVLKFLFVVNDLIRQPGDAT